MPLYANKSLAKLVETLRKPGDNEKSKINRNKEILTYILSHIQKIETLPSHNDEHFEHLCKFLIEQLYSKNESRGEEAKEEILICKNLLEYLLDTRCDKVLFLKTLLSVDRSKRLQIMKVLEIVLKQTITKISCNDQDFMFFIEDCLKSIDFHNMRWLLEENAENVELVKSTDSMFSSTVVTLEESIVYKTIKLLGQCLSTPNLEFTSSVEKAKFDAVIINKVMLLAYMGHKKQRTEALAILKKSVNSEYFVELKKRSPELWTKYKEDTKQLYRKRMLALVTMLDLDWGDQWELSIKILGPELHKCSGLINGLLNVEEKAFKSGDPQIRRQAFLSWKALIDNFALDPKELSSSRRVKLLCIPFVANNSKTEVISQTKIQIWWYFIVTLKEHLANRHKQVLLPFLNFCFGFINESMLLTSKIEVCGWPQNKFPVTRRLAIDALLQLLVVDKTELSSLYSLLENKLENCLNEKIFQENFQPFLRSVVKATVTLDELEYDEEKKKKLAASLWSNFFARLESSPSDLKADMYNTVIEDIIEFCATIAVQPFLQLVVSDMIFVRLVKSLEFLNSHHEKILVLIYVFTDSLMDKKLSLEQCTAFENLLQTSIKVKNMPVYNEKTLKIFSNIIGKLEKAVADGKYVPSILKIWCVVAKLATKYMQDNKEINESDGSRHSFVTIKCIVSFPFSCVTLAEGNHVSLKVLHVWLNLFKEYLLRTCEIITVRRNEIINDTFSMIHEKVIQNSISYSFLTHCWDVLIHHVDCRSIESIDELSPVIATINDTVSKVVEEKQSSAVTGAVKALNSLAKKCLENDSEKVESFYKLAKSAMNCTLKYEGDEKTTKEILNMWKTMSCFLENVNVVNHGFLLAYRDVFLAAARHKNGEFSSILDELLVKMKVKDVSKSLISQIKKEVRVSTPVKVPKFTQKIVKIFTPKSMVVKGIFDTPQSTNRASSVKKPAPAPFLSDDSQDFEIINSEYNYDFNRLTEHQKESLSKHQCDIPAMYSELSQSQDSNNLQNWFEKKSKAIGGNPNKENKVKHVEVERNCSTSISKVDSSVVEDGEHGARIVPKKLNFENQEEEETHVAPESSSLVTSSSDLDDKTKAEESLLSNSTQENSQKKEKDGTSLDEGAKSRRTKAEIERLKIDMVFDTSQSGRRKSKLKDKNDAEPIASKPKSQETEESSQGIKRRRSKLKTAKTVPEINLPEPSKIENSEPVIDEKMETEEIVPEKPTEAIVIPETQQSEIMESQDIVESSQKELEIKAPTSCFAKVAKFNKTDIDLAKEISTNGRVKGTASSFPEKRSPEGKKTIWSSPITHQNLEARKPFRASIGRTAHMMELVTKGMISDGVVAESASPPIKKKGKTHELSSVSRDVEKMSSPRGIRQQKMFSNMNLPSAKAFCNLKNDGEKVSPKGDKDSVNYPKRDHKEELLVWSTGPDLSASPSYSILKSKSFEKSVGTPTTSIKHKRVSFADPPVSRTMSYEVVSMARDDGKAPQKTKSQKRPFSTVPHVTGGSPKLKIRKLSLSEPETSKEMEKEIAEAECVVPLKENVSKNAEENVLKSVEENVPKGAEEIVKSLEENLFEIFDQFTPKSIDENMSTSLEFEEVAVEPVKTFESQITETQKDMFDSVENLADALEDQKPEKESVSGACLDDTVILSSVPTYPESIGSPAGASGISSVDADQNTQAEDIHPDTLDDVTPIYPALAACEKSVILILKDLTNPLWVEHLQQDLTSRNILTIGDLARLSERELNRLPIKGSNKAMFLRKILERFLISTVTWSANPEVQKNHEFEDGSLLKENVPMDTDAQIEEQVVTKDDAVEISSSSNNTVHTRDILGDESAVETANDENDEVVIEKCKEKLKHLSNVEMVKKVINSMDLSKSEKKAIFEDFCKDWSLDDIFDNLRDCAKRRFSRV